MSDSSPAPREGERARLGNRVPEHVYLDGEPLCTLPAATAAEVVRLLNAGATPATEPDAQALSTWTCAGRKANGANDPGECDWPVCGCDPHADKVIGALQERGLLPADPGAQAGAVEAEIGTWLWGRFMALCKARGWPPAQFGDLFQIATDARKHFATPAQATPPAPSAEPVPAGQGDGSAEDDEIGEGVCYLAIRRYREARRDFGATSEEATYARDCLYQLEELIRRLTAARLAPPAPSNAGGA